MNSRIIPAVRNENELVVAAKSQAGIIFMLSTNVESVKKQVDFAHKCKKKFFVHIDLADGIGKDEYGIKYLKSQGADGIITTRSNLVKIAAKHGMYSVQRFFIVDSQSVDTTIETVKSSKPNMIEIMPGAVSKIIKRIKQQISIPVVVGGLMETEEEIKEALSNGAVAISTGKAQFWEGFAGFA